MMSILFEIVSLVKSAEKKCNTEINSDHNSAAYRWYVAGYWKVMELSHMLLQEIRLLREHP